MKHPLSNVTWFKEAFETAQRHYAKRTCLEIRMRHFHQFLHLKHRTKVKWIREAKREYLYGRK